MFRNHHPDAFIAFLLKSSLAAPILTVTIQKRVFRNTHGNTAAFIFLVSSFTLPPLVVWRPRCKGIGWNDNGCTGFPHLPVALLTLPARIVILIIQIGVFRHFDFLAFSHTVFCSRLACAISALTFPTFGTVPGINQIRMLGNIDFYTFTLFLDITSVAIPA